MGANINLPRIDGESPLFLAAQRGDIELAKVLLMQQALVNRAAHNDKTPLSIAVECGHADMANLLLAYGADPRVLINNMPLNVYAASSGQMEMSLHIKFKLLASSPLTLPGSPRLHAYQLAVVNIAHHPESLDMLCSVFQALDVIDHICLTQQPANSNEAAILIKLADNVKLFYSHYFENGEPHDEVLQELKHQTEILKRLSFQAPRYHSSETFFKSKSPFMEVIEKALDPILSMTGRP